jgi:hypothetical protein
LVSGGWRRLKWPRERVERCQQVLAEQSFHTYRHPLEVAQRHPDTPVAVVDYRELVENPESAITALYDTLGLPLTPEYREILAAETARARKHVSGHSYSLEEFGLDADAIETRLADLYERYGWQRPPQETSA